ncbi:MAG: hypothetical protein PVJ38_01080 [Candidatus Bathyarchaeota archaeon]|jgi:hypothetical protein
MKEPNTRSLSPPDFNPATDENRYRADCKLWFRGYLGENRGAWIESMFWFGGSVRENKKPMAQVHDIHIEISDQLEKAIQLHVSGDQA